MVDAPASLGSRRRAPPDRASREAFSGWAFVLVSAAVLGLRCAGLSVDLLGPSVATAVAIVVLGVPHGAHDVALARRRWNLGTPGALFAFLAAYLALAGAVLVVWVLVPAFVMVGFLLASGFHLAGDWEGRMGPWSRGVVGAPLVTAPTLLHRADVSEAFAWIVPAPVAATVPSLMADLAGPMLVGAGGVLAATCLSHPRSACEGTAALPLALFTPPLRFFMIYYCGLHAVRHVEEAHRELAPGSGAAFLALSLPYAPLAVAGTLLAGWLATRGGPTSAPLGTAFLALAALTAPHMLLVDLRRPKSEA